MEEKFDLVVVGSGTTGSTVASKCRAAGWSVAVIDSLPFGGTCALRGCDPKKVLVGAAELIDFSARLREKRTVTGQLSIDWSKLIQFKRSFTAPIPRQKEESFEKAGITNLHGRAKFVGPRSLEVAGRRLDAKHFVIAAGARPAILGISGEEHLINSTQFLELDRLPTEIAFVGGGYIAMEFAHIAVRAGARVSVLHRGARVLEGFDPDLVAALSGRTQELGIRLHTETVVEGIEKVGTKFVLHAKSRGKELSISCDLAVHAAGRVPDIDEVERMEEGVRVNDYLQSVSNPAVYAGGDAAATSGLPLTPVAGYDGKVIAANLLDGNQQKAEYNAIPTVVFTIPPLASVGLSEETAMQTGLRARKNHAQIGGWYSSRRVAEKTAAFKVLIEEGSDRILGAHLLGPAAEETINLFALAMREGMTAKALKGALFSYPTHASDVQYML
ncbi:MAG TPA: NAD(P)/FAD-dependent oxidoreductase [Candidatus Binatia bacterium]|nr:NAD(P)/FAD-dependent oxidoreductase [Candidatus Binatia bacterium]